MKDKFSSFLTVISVISVIIGGSMQNLKNGVFQTSRQVHLNHTVFITRREINEEFFKIIKMQKLAIL